jgi:hypothetical protein
MKARKIPVIVEAHQLTSDVYIGPPGPDQVHGIPGNWLIFEAGIDAYLLSDEMFKRTFEILQPGLKTAKGLQQPLNIIAGECPHCHGHNLTRKGSRMRQSGEVFRIWLCTDCKKERSFPEITKEDESRIDKPPSEDKTSAKIYGWGGVPSEIEKSASPQKPTYTDEQKQFIRNAPDAKAAIKLFREKYPDEKRSDGGIISAWYGAQAKKMKTGPELGDTLRLLHRRLIAQLQNDIVTPNRIIVTLGVIKASGSEEIDEGMLHRGGTILFDIEDMRISTSFLLNFSKDRTLESFNQDQPISSSIKEIERKINTIAFQTGETPEQVLNRAQTELEAQKAGAE